MLWVCADRYGLELDERQRTFKAVSFSPALADDRRSGTVTLYPGIAVLNVGSSEEDYSCVRLFDEAGRVIGAMRRSPGGEVTWSMGGGVAAVFDEGKGRR
jgi:hypothetical protein